MPSILAKKAEAIHARLVKKYGLTEKQALFLPHIDEMSEALLPVSADMGMAMMQSFMTPEDHAWMNNAANLEMNLEAALADLTPPREITLDSAQQKRWQLLNEISGFTIDFMYADEEKHRARALKDYGRFCRKIVLLQRENDASPRAPLDETLVKCFPMPSPIRPPATKRKLAGPKKTP